MNGFKYLAAAAVATVSISAQAVTVEQQAFFNNLAKHCGNAYEGKVVSTDKADADFASKRLVMHVRECSDDVIKVPFHVGDDHSRTWVITKTIYGLHLAHDHRHKDGSEDKVTMYGGMTANFGIETKQSFPVDARSINNFRDNGLDVSITNIWHLYLKPNTFSYQLTRANRNFKVDFDLTKPVALPPVPWGHE